MAHKCIKYRLTAEGTIPTFLCFHEGSVGGAYAKWVWDRLDALNA